MDAGHYSMGQVSLSDLAPDGGAQILFVSSDKSVVLVSNDTRIRAGERSGQFHIYAMKVTAASSATITASYNGSSQSATVNVNPAAAPPPVSLTGFSGPASVNGGESGYCELNLSGNAGDGGVTVSISSDSAKLTCDGSVLIQHGQSSRHFGFHTSSVDASTDANLTASNNGVSKSLKITINPAPAAVLAELGFDPRKLPGGKAGHGFVALSGRAGSGGAIVALSSDSSLVTLPASVSIVPNGHDRRFEFQTSAVTAETLVTVTATLGSSSKSAQITLLPAVQDPPLALAAFSVSGDGSMTGGGMRLGYVALNHKTGAGGASVALLSGNPDVVQVPADAAVSAGDFAKKFYVLSKGVDSDTSVTLTASFNGASKTATLTVHPAQLGRVGLDHDGVLGGNSVNLHLQLEGVAGPSGASVALSSSDPSVQLPASANFDKGQWKQGVVVTTSSVTQNKQVTITATYNGTSKTVILNVRAK